MLVQVITFLRDERLPFLEIPEEVTKAYSTQKLQPQLCDSSSVDRFYNVSFGRQPIRSISVRPPACAKAGSRSIQLLYSP